MTFFESLAKAHNMSFSGQGLVTYSTRFTAVKRYTAVHCNRHDRISFHIFVVHLFLQQGRGVLIILLCSPLV